MKKKRTMILILTLALAITLIGGSYAYFSVIFNDNRSEENNTNTSIKTCHIAEATRIENIENSVGSFQVADIYPGHREVASLSVTASGVIGATSSFQFVYDIEENTLQDNIKVSVYESNEKISTTENHFNCKKEVTNENGVTKYYETCEEKELGSLLSETILTEESKQVIGTDTLVITNDKVDKTKYYYVVLEFLNKEESQNEYQNKVLKGGVNVELTHEKSIYTECILNGSDPVLEDELIPITINADGVVKKADVKEKWYSYEEKEWANAVILKDESITYENNDIIPEENIESYFVWIPKYRYRLWDIGNYHGLTSIDESKVHTIPLVFGDYNTSDEVDGECTTPMESGESGACQVGDYMTHPAFLSIPSTGFWVGKFETSKSNTNPDNSINPAGIQIKPNVVSWRNIQVGNAFYTTYDFEDSKVLDKASLNKIIAYNGKLFSSELNRGEEYRDLKKVKQVVIIGKSTIKLEEKLLSKNYYKNESRRLSDMQEIDIIRIDKVGLSDYNKDNKRMRELIRFIGANNQEERDNLANGRRKLMEMNQELKKISKNFEVPPGYDRAELRYAQGYDEGVEKSLKETAKNMLEKNYTIEEISDITGLKKENIQKMLMNSKSMNLV